MLQQKEKKIIFSYSHCQQCGICESICPTKAITTKLNSNGLSFIYIDDASCIHCQKCVRTCPSNNVSIDNDYFAKLLEKSYFFGYSSDNVVRRESSSGGICKTLIIEGLKNKTIDGVYSLKKSNEYPYAEGEFYTYENIPTYEEIPNSIYHSVMLGKHISKVKKCNRLMIVGTACQLSALEKGLKGKYQELIKVCIFCKQQKTLDSTRFLAKVLGKSIDLNTNFKAKYRGKGWPGIVQIKGAELPWNRAAQLPFGRRLWTVPGCNICGDPFGIQVKADLSLMDPWSICKANQLGETLITVHTEKGMALLQNTPNITLKAKTYEEIEPALGLKDIYRKQQLTSYFLGEECTQKAKWAGRMEYLQRKYLQTIAMKIPRMPFIFYRILCKLPDWRNIILK